MYGELQDTQLPGLRYATFKLDDGLSFVHLAWVSTADGNSPLPKLHTFQQFQADIRERCDEQPVVSGLEEIGSFRWLSD